MVVFTQINKDLRRDGVNGREGAFSKKLSFLHIEIE
jgi:hypothetical protein